MAHQTLAISQGDSMETAHERFMDQETHSARAAIRGPDPDGLCAVGSSGPFGRAGAGRGRAAWTCGESCISEPGARCVAAGTHGQLGGQELSLSHRRDAAAGDERCGDA